MSRVDEMKSFVSNELRDLKEQQKLLELHICACEVVLESNRGSCTERLTFEQSIVQGRADYSEVMQFLELSMYRQMNPWNVMQLACLW